MESFRSSQQNVVIQYKIYPHMRALNEIEGQVVVTTEYNSDPNFFIRNKTDSFLLDYILICHEDLIYFSGVTNAQ